MDTFKRDVVRSQMPGSLICTATMDLQQVLSTPALTHSQMYYSRQLSNFNLGIHIGDTNDAYMCLWHEGITGRGGNEIASCVLEVFSSGATNKKKIIMWSDNCAGQNKNRMIIPLWIYLIKLGIFDEIEHKFLMTGHSYYLISTDTALIENRKKLCSPMVPNDLIKIEEARYKVIPMDKENFFDFQKAADSIITTDKMCISKVNSQINKIRVRTTLNEMESWRVINILKRNKTNDLNSTC